jgi:hypothetical protein
VPIRPLLRDGHFTPEEVATLTAVFDEVLQELRLADRNDPAAFMVAKRIIAVASQGVRDRATLKAAVLKSFTDDPGVSGM